MSELIGMWGVFVYNKKITSIFQVNEKLSSKYYLCTERRSTKDADSSRIILKLRDIYNCGLFCEFGEVANFEEKVKSL